MVHIASSWRSNFQYLLTVQTNKSHVHTLSAIQLATRQSGCSTWKQATDTESDLHWGWLGLACKAHIAPSPDLSSLCLWYWKWSVLGLIGFSLQDSHYSIALKLQQVLVYLLESQNAELCSLRGRCGQFKIQKWQHFDSNSLCLLTWGTEPVVSSPSPHPLKKRHGTHLLCMHEIFCRDS